jgi:DNA polymerase III subunit chi
VPEISFYVLPTESSQERYLLACKLIEKAYRNEFLTYVLTDSTEQSQLIDDLLWTFRAGSFIPHQIDKGELTELENVVLIGSDPSPEMGYKTLINLSTRIPDGFTKAERILELIDDSEEAKALGRDRYRHYQQAEMGISIHKM